MKHKSITDIATRRKRTAKPRKLARLTDEEWWAQMARDYPHVDAAKSYEVASRWAAAHGRACSRPFLLNWWKRSEEDARPVAAPPARAPAAAALAAPQINSTVAALLVLEEQGRRERAQRKVAVK